MTGREERIARNEVLFRDLNERLREVVTSISGEAPDLLEIFCECGAEQCMARITVQARQYEEVRSRPERFLVAPDHDVPDVESVVACHDRYWVVEKHPEEAQIAREEDPRS